MSEGQEQQAEQKQEQQAEQKQEQQSGSSFDPITTQEEFDRALSKRLERERAKFSDYDELRSKVQEFDKARKASMSEAERAVAEAEERGRTAVRTEYGARLARSEFVSEAARRNPGWDASAVLEDLNLSRYIGDDGEPDTKAIAKAVERIVPEAQAVAPGGFDLGARTTATNGANMSDILRKAAGRA